MPISSSSNTFGSTRLNGSVKTIVLAAAISTAFAALPARSFADPPSRGEVKKRATDDCIVTRVEAKALEDAEVARVDNRAADHRQRLMTDPATRDAYTRRVVGSRIDANEIVLAKMQREDEKLVGVQEKDRRKSSMGMQPAKEQENELYKNEMEKRSDFRKSTPGVKDQADSEQKRDRISDMNDARQDIVRDRVSARQDTIDEKKQDQKDAKDDRARDRADDRKDRRDETRQEKQDEHRATQKGTGQ